MACFAYIIRSVDTANGITNPGTAAPRHTRFNSLFASREGGCLSLLFTHP